MRASPTLPSDVDTSRGVPTGLNAATHPYAVIEHDHAGWQIERSRHATPDGAQRAAVAHRKPLVRAYVWKGAREGWAALEA